MAVDPDSPGGWWDEMMSRPVRWRGGTASDRAVFVLLYASIGIVWGACLLAIAAATILFVALSTFVVAYVAMTTIRWLA